MLQQQPSLDRNSPHWATTSFVTQRLLLVRSLLPFQCAEEPDGIAVASYLNKTKEVRGSESARRCGDDKPVTSGAHLRTERTFDQAILIVGKGWRTQRFFCAGSEGLK